MELGVGVKVLLGAGVGERLGVSLGFGVSVAVDVSVAVGVAGKVSVAVKVGNNAMAVGVGVLVGATVGVGTPGKRLQAAEARNRKASTSQERRMFHLTAPMLHEPSCPRNTPARLLRYGVGEVIGALPQSPTIDT